MSLPGPDAPAGAPFAAAFRLPMAVRFRGVDVREGVLIEGPAGWGEFSPFWDYDTWRAVPWLYAAREAAFSGWPPPVRDSVPVNATVPAVGPERAQQLVGAAGCTTVKVKVAEPGQGLDADVERVAAVRDALGPAGKVRVDANGAWNAEEAVQRIRALDIAAGGLEYVEQPCPTIDELASVRRRVHVPIAADESVRMSDDPLRVVRAEAADIVVLKVAPMGGVASCLIVAEQVGVPVVVSSALETSVGLAAGVALAAALPELPYACGLGTARLLAGDLASEPLLAVDGQIAVRRVSPDRDLLTASSLDEEGRLRWAERLARVEADA
ncbi:o-succinylbenzoate synthase [Motilibacter deserti]|uniref:o-succinylbenzoate synthase n=1 Tax=Motilibacter deserti TaxID=2714956 RepID=A0ABX0GZA8_9ACTN|nr:o-succinylbenzoate synthase [Motilibacter deserti]NHC14924.1 o-succinylbenzoate synthase [Motilibacter deserti]